MKIFVPDTNFFLQCQPADKIAWKLVTHDSDVLLLVVREVRKELDRLKSGGNQRRSKRARAASAVLRRLTTEGLTEIELRTSSPRVVLRTTPRPDPTALPVEYHIETPDERIVAEAFAARTIASEALTFLSHDSVPLEDAASLGLPTQVIPEEWLLEPEPSEVERELGDVKRRMKLLEGRVPELAIELPRGVDGIARLSSPYFPSLTDSFIAAAMRGVRKAHPLATAPDTSTLLGRNSTVAYAEEARWARYASAHAQWLTDVETALGNLSNQLCEDPSAMKLPLSIANHGHAAAEHLIVRIEVHGDFHLVDIDALEEPDDLPELFPQPPAPPSQRGMAGFGDLSFSHGAAINPQHYAPLHLPTPVLARDRHTLYLEYDNERKATFLEGQCADFRHGLRPEEIMLSLERNTIGNEAVRGALSVLVSAGNLIESKKMTFPVLIEPKIEDTEALARELLKHELAVEII
ncbi:hypothetical protein D7Y51_17445 [Stenotrophomonas maltophilia]|uniref:PIN domain-containing protein n=1 Tax=Stenotrophomonas maltophilia TaxID=40324 RepID=UPI001376F726|nr:PIN domain-containing protein [Stenotrophomonas maltophilia]MBA0444868.1 hypothetical protein [Stenotrophomonas maltophilia]WNV16712.1 PIN domain-containing protein [Stenotrophomonas maltophilia]